MARYLDADSNHLWTAFGPTNVKIHCATIAVALGDVRMALDLIREIDTAGLPAERRVRHAARLRPHGDRALRGWLI
jgi:hypothetical protein